MISQDEARVSAEKFKKADFSLEDFRDQLKMIGKMGSIGSLIKMLPGMGALKDQIDSVDTDRELKRINAILNSMTLEERHNPDLLNGSRRSRIARGSGTEVSEINQFMKRFLEARKMMKQMGKMGALLKGASSGGGLPPGLRPKRGGRGFWS